MSASMNLKIFSLLIVILLSILLLGCIDVYQDNIKYNSNENFIPKENQGKMTFNFTVRTDELTQLARLWIPYPVSNDYQEINDYTIEGNYDYSGIFRESEYGTMILYAEWNNPETFPKLNFSYNITRKERIRKNFTITNDLIPIDIKQYLLPTSLGPTDGVVKDLSDEVIKGNKTILEKAIAVYDYLIEHGERDANLSFCGDGDVCELLKNLRGKCADFSSVFVALTRSAGVPSREIFGTRISKEGDVTGNYHCHAEFYLPEYGWIPVDPSDVAKLMLNEDLEIDDEKVVNARDYFFGTQSETYVDLAYGRDVMLNPKQDGPPLNYFMYPYAEVDGDPLDFISQEYLKYIVTFEDNL
jgi:transglutaminase-like putative cysteine protease